MANVLFLSNTIKFIYEYYILKIWSSLLKYNKDNVIPLVNLFIISLQVLLLIHHPLDLFPGRYDERNKNEGREVKKKERKKKKARKERLGTACPIAGLHIYVHNCWWWLSRMPSADTWNTRQQHLQFPINRCRGRCALSWLRYASRCNVCNARAPLILAQLSSTPRPFSPRFRSFVATPKPRPCRWTWTPRQKSHA